MLCDSTEGCAKHGDTDLQRQVREGSELRVGRYFSRERGGWTGDGRIRVTTKEIKSMEKQRSSFLVTLSSKQCPSMRTQLGRYAILKHARKKSYFCLFSACPRCLAGIQ